MQDLSPTPLPENEPSSPLVVPVTTTPPRQEFANSSSGGLKRAAIIWSIISLPATVFLCFALASTNQPYGVLAALFGLVVWVPFGLIPGIIALISWGRYNARQYHQS